MPLKINLVFHWERDFRTYNSITLQARDSSPSPPLVSFYINPLKNLKSAESTGQLFSLFPLKEDHEEKWRREKVKEKEENTKGQSGINK